MPTVDSLQPERCAKLLASLASPERLKIVRFLAEESHNVGEVAAMLGVPVVNASHHLHVLEVSGLITGRKEGRFVWYAMQPGVLERLPKAAGRKGGRKGGRGDTLNLGCCQIVLPPERLAASARPKTIGKRD
ncbi:MAG: ArsR/SmtB family transcription factor [Planctomycetia bacterium]